MVPGFKISVLHDETKQPHCSDTWNFRISLCNLQKPTCDERLGFLLSGFLYVGPGPQGSGLHPVQGELFFLFVKIEWNHVSNGELYKLSNTYKLLLIYKCDVGIFEMCKSWLQCMATPCLSLVSPGLEKALMGRPISHAPKTTSSKQGQATRKGPNLIALCSGYNLQWEGREEKPTYPPSTYPSGH